MVVGALIVKHVEKLSDEKTIQAIQENPYMQYLLGLEKFTGKPIFVPELFVLVRKRLDHDFFNMLTLMLAETDGSKPKKEHTDEDGNDHGGTMKIDATCCDAEVRYPTDSNLLEDGSRLNEIEGTFGTTKRVYRANDIRAKLDQTADTWIGACFFAKNIMKFLRGLLCLIFEKSGLKTFQKRMMNIFDSMEAVLPTPQGCMKEINKQTLYTAFTIRQMYKIIFKYPANRCRKMSEGEYGTILL